MNTLVVIVAHVLAATPIVVPKQVDEHFKSFQWQAPSGPSISHYRLYAPPTNGDVGRLPLLIWLHGEGERGIDNINQLRWLNLIFDANQGDPRMFILAVQRPVKEPWANSNQSSDAIRTTYDITLHLLQRYPIDPDRVYLAGVSSGATAAWEMACRYPRLFAAVAPLGSDGAEPDRAGKLVKIPIWAFHSKSDRYPVDGDCAMIRAIQAAGGNAKLTMTDQRTPSSHDCWTPAFQDFHLLQWLLAQSRDAPPQWLPENVEGVFSWKKLNAAICVGFGSNTGTVLLLAPWGAIAAFLWMMSIVKRKHKSFPGRRRGSSSTTHLPARRVF